MNIPKVWLHIGSAVFDSSKFNAVTNREYFNKPLGGLWGAAYTPDNESKSAWHEFSGQSGPAFTFTLKDDARILLINDQQDLSDFIDIVGNTMNEKVFWDSITTPNFEVAAEYWDVIYLTPKGQVSTHLPFDGSRSLYGWDVPSCLVLHPHVVTMQESLEVAPYGNGFMVV